MEIDKISSWGYPTGYETGKTSTAASANAFGNQMANVSDTKATNMTLHCFDNDEGDTVVGAIGHSDGSSVTVYKPKDFDSENPVYKVKIWDAEGNVTERMIDISEINLKKCDYTEMFAYTSHLSDSGEYPDAQKKFMMASNIARAEDSSYTYEDMFQTEDWLKVIKSAMQMQYDLGNLKGYLDYKKFLDFLQ